MGKSVEQNSRGLSPRSRLETSRFLRRAPLQWFRFEGSAEHAAAAAEIDLRGAPGVAQRLAEKMTVTMGLGAVGGPALTTFARSGVGRVVGVDPDRYEPVSWLTQPASIENSGQLKARVQGARAHAANPGCRVLTVAGFAQDLPLWLLRQADLLVAAGDNLEILVWAGNAAAALGIPLLQGAVHGETWTAFVRSYDLRDPQTACPACAFSNKEWANLQAREGCDPGLMLRQGRESTRTLPVVCSTAAGLLAAESLKRLLAMGAAGWLGSEPSEAPSAGGWGLPSGGPSHAAEEFSFCLLSKKPMRTRLERNPDCRCPHVGWNLLDVDGDRSQVTLEMLAKRFGPKNFEPDIRGELPWISFTLCPGCNRQISVRRFGRPGDDLVRCECGARPKATPLGVRSVLPRDDLRAVADVPLADLGLPQGAAVGVGDGETWTYCFVGPPPELTTEGDCEPRAVQPRPNGALRPKASGTTRCQ